MKKTYRQHIWVMVTVTVVMAVTGALVWQACRQPVMLTLGLVLGTVMLLGLFIVWLVCRRIKYAEAA